jgi:hypothetical protein
MRCSQCSGLLKGYFEFSVCSNCYTKNVNEAQRKLLEKGKVKMSINLCFYTKAKKPRHIDFPFQTPTEWTWEIYTEKNVDKRCAFLRSKMKDNPWLDESLVADCEGMLRDEDLKLSYI